MTPPMYVSEFQNGMGNDLLPALSPQTTFAKVYSCWSQLAIVQHLVRVFVGKIHRATLHIPFERWLKKEEKKKKKLLCVAIPKRQSCVCSNTRGPSRSCQLRQVCPVCVRANGLTLLAEQEKSFCPRLSGLKLIAKSVRESARGVYRETNFAMMELAKALQSVPRRES